MFIMLPSFLRREALVLPLCNLQAKAVSLLPDCGAALGNCRYSRQLLQNRTSSQSKPIPQRSKLVLMMQRFVLYDFLVFSHHNSIARALSREHDVANTAIVGVAGVEYNLIIFVTQLCYGRHAGQRCVCLAPIAAA